MEVVRHVADECVVDYKCHTLFGQNALMGLPFEIMQHLLHLLLLLGCDGVRMFVLFIFLEERGKHVFDGLAIGVAHGVRCGIDYLRQQLVGKSVALAVAANDAVDFPPCQFIEEFVTRDAYLAHEELVQFVGGC